MELGEKIRQTRLEAGLSQRKLCGDQITRNMLSLIENGSAKPSMDTLAYLAARLGKPMGYFLEEKSVPSLEEARAAWLRRDGAALLSALEAASEARNTPEGQHLYQLGLMLSGEQAAAQGRLPYARELLERCGNAGSLYWTEAQERRRLLLLAQADPERRSEILDSLPPEDTELLLRAEAALSQGDALICAAILEAARDKSSPRWLLARGDAHLALREYEQAAACFHRIEAASPSETAPRLEVCYRELRDFEKAYYYALRQREGR